MIEIRNASGLIAELYDDTQITVEKNNPLFNTDDKLFEDITYPFKLPATDNNKLFLNWGHLVEADNKVYELEVDCIVSGYPFFAGKLSYSYVDGDFDALLKVNFGSLAERLKTELINKAQTADAMPGTFDAAFMKTVCENPTQYPFSFFTIKNRIYFLGQNLPTNNFATQDVIDSINNFYNAWFHNQQNFYVELIDLTTLAQFGISEPIRFSRQKANFKLKYIIVKLIEALGFKAVGSWIDDVSNDNIYLYNHIYIENYLLDSSTYYPAGYTFSEFFKILRDDPRLQITFFFDVFKGEVIVESALSLLENNKYTDIRDFVTQIEEITPPKINGYTISLTPNALDNLFNDPSDASKKIPTNRLLIGDGEKKIEINATTFKSANLDNDRSCPDTLIDFRDQSIESNTLTEKKSIILLKYDGMKQLPNNKVFPEAYPFELDVSHAKWYQFLNETKEVKITAYLPLSVLVNLKVYEKILFKSKEGLQLQAIIKKVEFNIGHNDEEFLATTITCCVIQQLANTPVTLLAGQNEIVNEYSFDNNYVFKAYYAERNAPLKFDVFYPAGTTIEAMSPLNGGALAYSITYSGEITKSTDYAGIGGSSQTLKLPKVIDAVNNVEIRIYEPAKYIVYVGEKFNLTYNASGYWFAKIFTAQNKNKNNYKPIWIVF